jgi:hypothetical protein
VENLSHENFKSIEDELKVKVHQLISFFRSKTAISAILLNEIIEKFGDFIYD